MTNIRGEKGGRKGNGEWRRGRSRKGGKKGKLERAEDEKVTRRGRGRGKGMLKLCL